MFRKKLIVIPFLLLFIMGGCTQPQKQFDAQNKQKMQAIIWDGVPYHTYGYLQEASKNQAKPMSLDKALLGVSTSKIKHLTKYLNHTEDSFNSRVPVAHVYHGLDMGIFTLLSHEVDDMMVTYIDDKLAHVYVSLKKEKKKKKLSDEAIKKEVIKKFGSYSQALKEMYVVNFMQDEPLVDIKDMLNKKFGQAFYYGSAEANNDSNEIWTWGMRKNFYYKVVVNQENKYAYLSIKSKAFMKMSREEIMDVEKWQREQDGIAESMVTVHRKDKK
jgi:hypothetical protein